MRNDDRKIKTEIIVINGKKVKYQKIPTGMSGLDAQTKANLEFKDDNNNSQADSSIEIAAKKNTKLGIQVQNYFDNGDISNEEIEDFAISSSKPSKEFGALFDELTD